MRPRTLFAALVSCAVLLPGLAAAEPPRGTPSPDTPSADAIFSAAKSAWRTRREAPYVAFNLRERYEWRGRTHDNWWQVSYRDMDRMLALRRLIVMDDERERLKGVGIGLHIKFHKQAAKADSFDTNASADAFPILEPQIEPNASFGLLKREPKMALVGRATPLPATGPNAAPSAAPVATPTATPVKTASPYLVATEKPLREVGRVEAVARDYAIAFAGSERVRGSETYHLSLTPLRNPHVYRLRDLWVESTTFATVQLAVQGLFDGRPYDDARWTVGFTPIDGRYYIQQIRADEPLRFGLDRVVRGLTFDFVSYAFPPAIPDMTFQRLL
ncbi:MAG: hypothetical protein NVSMB19_16610 [Vulcanimicrobiaceae bacterium]